MGMWKHNLFCFAFQELGSLDPSGTEGSARQQGFRPKIITVSAILFGLLPIMWSPATRADADVMKRIATPIIGGVITSAILELLIYPVILRTLAEALIGWLMIQR